MPRVVVADLAATDTVVLRTPLLPWTSIEEWSAGVDATDRTSLRRRLHALAARPEVREALFLASPSLHDELDSVDAAKRPERTRKREAALTRYLLRMSGRATPLGLLAAWTLGTVGSTTDLTVAPLAACRRHLRLGGSYLDEVADGVAGDPTARAAARYRANDTITDLGGRIRFLAGERGASGFTALSVEATAELRALLACARAGADRAGLAASIRGLVAVDDVEALVDEVIDVQLVVPEPLVPITGDHSLAAVDAHLAAAGAPPELRRRVDDATASIAAIEAAPIGVAAAAYRAVADGLGARTPVTRLLRCDLERPQASCSVGPAAVREILRAADLLRRLGRRPEHPELDRFRAAFVARYDRRAVPLGEALDPDAGIGFASPLQRVIDAGLDPLPEPGTGDTRRWTSWDRRLLRRLLDATARGERAIELTAEDLAAAPPAPPTTAFGAAAIAVIAARSAAAIDAGDFAVHVRTVIGPSPTMLLGRYGDSSAELTERLRSLARAEEDARPGSVFAEIAYWPRGGRSDIALRPVLRRHEIAYLGGSGVPPEDRLTIDDLLVAVVDGRLVLRSRKLDREVVPRLTAPYNLGHPQDPPVFRFLCAMQGQDDLHCAWSWGGLDQAPFLPRVTCGRIVVAPARWTLDRAALSAVRHADDVARAAAVADLRRRLDLPRWITVGDQDQLLPIDLDNALALDALAHLARGRDQLPVSELWPATDQLCARGPDGAFRHELVVPLCVVSGARRTTSDGAAAPRPLFDVPSGERTRPLGSDWLYVKWYAGEAAVDDLLRCEVRGLTRSVMAQGDVARWFVLRYADPDHHLRLRLQGEARALRERVQPEIEALTARLMRDGRIWRLQLDTYEREVERYGGVHGMALAEDVFHADSEAAVELLAWLAGLEREDDDRWLVVALSIDRLLDDVGFDDRQKHRLLQALASTRLREAGNRIGELATKYRLVAQRLARTLAVRQGGDAGWRGAVAALDTRSRRLAPVVERLRSGLSTGAVAAPLGDFVASFVHLAVLRLVRGPAVLRETVLYDHLCRHYRSRVATSRPLDCAGGPG